MYWAGAILLTSAIVSQFRHSDLIFATIITATAPLILYWGYRQEKINLLSCLRNRRFSYKFFIALSAIIVALLGFGFSVGKLIYLWSNL